MKELTHEWLFQASQAERDMPRGDQLQALVEFAGHNCLLKDNCGLCRCIKGSSIRWLRKWQNEGFCPSSPGVRERRGQHEEAWRDDMVEAI